MSALTRRLDDWARRRPAWMTAVIVLLAMVATLLLLSESKGAVVLYQAF